MTDLHGGLALIVIAAMLAGCAQRLLDPSPATEVADANSAEALYEQGVLHALGEGVPQDHAEAAGCFERAALQGHPQALYALYLLHETGKREATQEGKSLQWLTEAATAGLVEAMFDLGTHYAKGRGVPKDVEEAAQWFGKAAERGEPRAQFALAMMLVTGKGVPRDRVAALQWLTLAERGLEGDQRALAAKRREALRRSMDPVDIAEADRRAEAWRPRQN